VKGSSSTQTHRGYKRYLPYLALRILTSWVNVASYGSFKERRLLRNDTKARPQIMKTQGANIYPIDDDLAFCRLYEPEQYLD
jgi:hypothetical protein